MALSGEPLLVAGDATLLRQVVHNLLQNALDAIPAEPAGEVRLATRLLPGRALLQVQDNGPGFAEDLGKRLFEPYVTTKAKGTGLGLAVVKKIAEEHGARVDVSNRIVDGHVAGAQVSLTFEPATESPGTSNAAG